MKKILLILVFVFNYFTYICCVTFVKIPSNNVIIGSNEFTYKILGDNKTYFLYKENIVEINEFEISKYLVTNSDYYKFKQSTNYKTSEERKRFMDMEDKFNETSIKNNPVIDISVFDAIAYIQWFSEINGEMYRLPTNAEWEYMAMGKEKSKYPWGNENKILESTKTTKPIYRHFFSIYEIKEDVSSLGICNIYGGTEFVLDSYRYEKTGINYNFIPYKNPIVFFEGNAQFSSRGGVRYNSFDNNHGLYFRSWAEFDNSMISSFRMVKDNKTIFNQNEIDECVYYIGHGKNKNLETKIFLHPIESDFLYTITGVEDFYILFKSTNNDYYRVYYKVVSQHESSIFNFEQWETGWVKSNDIILTDKKWYEN